MPLRPGGTTINAKKQQASSIQALKIIVDNVDSIAQRLCSSVGFRPCVVCLVLISFSINMVLCNPS